MTTERIEVNFNTRDFTHQDRLERSKGTFFIPVKVKKEVTLVSEDINLDKESPELKDLICKARNTRTLPERERPRHIMNLLRERVDYSFERKLFELEKNDKDLVQAVRRNNRSPVIEILALREAVRLGYANCNTMTISMLILGKEAGLEGAYLTNAPQMGNRDGFDPNPIINIIRNDTRQKLFREYEAYENFPEGHGWAELRTSEGEWIPVDPATQLVGDCEAGMDTFRKARYRAALFMDVNFTSNGRNLNHKGIRDLEFFPGEDVHIGKVELISDRLLPGISSAAQPSPILMGVKKHSFAPNLAIGVNFSIL